MMKKSVKKVMLQVMATAMAVSFGALVSAEDETISLTVWGAEEDQTLLKELIDNFQAAYPDQTFDIQIGVESESTAKDTVLTDVEAAADVYAFADDQITDLVKAGALLKLDDCAEVLQMAGKTLDDVKDANVEGSVDAAGKKVGMTLASGWYNASFFYGVGFTTALHEDGTTAVD